MKLLNLIIGGAAGTIARYLLAGAVYKFTGAGFPCPPPKQWLVRD